jgi:hypothetical protein
MPLQETDFFAGLSLAAHVGDRSGIVTDDDEGEARIAALGPQASYAFLELRANGCRHGKSIDQLGCHMPSSAF